MAKKNFMILGAGRFGSSLAKTLVNLGNEVLIVDENPDVVQTISESVTHAIIGDCSDEGVLRSLGVSNFDTVIVALSENMKSSILATVTLKELGANYVIARATDRTHAKILEKIGAEKVIMPENEMGERLAHQITSSKFLDYIELSDQFSIAEIPCLHKWISKTLRDLDLRGKYKINVIAVEHNDNIEIMQDSDYRVQPGDMFVVIGHNDDIHRLQNLK